jgi:hypothetical protein
MNIHHSHQLTALRRAKGLTHLEIDVNNFLYGELPLYLFRYAAWALADKGTAVVTASRTVDSMGMVLGRWSFQFVLQAAVKALAGIAELTAVDVNRRQFRFRRNTPNAALGPWSAVVMFSGQDSEKPLLEKCLMGLLLQPELTNGGQIVVCGPAFSTDVVKGWENVEYLAYESEKVAGRFLVGRKKNFAVSQMRHEKVLVCHTRIVLGLGCLASLPENFDAITPLVSFVGAKGRNMPYADLLFQRFTSTSIYTHTPAPYIGYSRHHWIEHLRNYHPFIDGALFCTRKTLFQQIQLSDVIAWGEGEDVEWARRLMMSGKLLELCIDAQALSLVNKSVYYNRWGHLASYKWLAQLKGHCASIFNRLLR